MPLAIKRIRPEDRALLEYIEAQLIEPELACNDAAHLTKLLADDRTYVWAALLDEEIIGYALVYRFPALYGQRSMARAISLTCMTSRSWRRIAAKGQVED